MKTRLVAIVSALVVLVACGGVAAWYFLMRPERLDFDKLGGTILVYKIEIDPQKAEADIADRLAEALQGRLDPNDRGEAEVRVAGKNRMEIRVPRTANFAEKLKDIKALISKDGTLELRMLANAIDDVAVIGAREGAGDARLAINDAGNDPVAAKELEDAQQQGLPPPPPREIRGGERKSKKYQIATAGGIKSAVTYSWVELGPQELRSLNLDNAAENDPTRNAAWLAASKRRNQALQLRPSDDKLAPLLLEGALFFSRECKNANLPEAERQAKKVEYFVLTRDPEFRDLLVEARTDKIDGTYVNSAYASTAGDRPVVYFSLNSAGAELLGNLTRKNVSESTGAAAMQRRRLLAIILDGQIVSAPAIQSEIRAQGQLTGNFTQKEVDDIVNVLRVGRLPAKLKRGPLSETEVGPKAN